MNKCTTAINNGDIKAIINRQSELHSLLMFVCQDGLQAFIRLSGEDQRNLLRLARTASLELSGLVNDCLAEPMARATQQATEEVAT